MESMPLEPLPQTRERPIHSRAQIRTTELTLSSSQERQTRAGRLCEKAKRAGSSRGDWRIQSSFHNDIADQ